MDILTLGHGHRPGETAGNNSVKTERHFLDFIVSGQSLGHLVNAFMADQVGVFGWAPDVWYQNNLIDEFLGLVNSALTTGRTSFYVCPECGDIGCGAITATIDVTSKQVTWKDFGYETDYSAPDFSGYQPIGPFIFERTAYFKTFNELRRQILKR